MPKERLPVTDFRGGLNVDSSPDNLADNQLAKADNVDLYEMGGLTKRKGTAYFNAVSYGAQVEQAFEWPRNDGSVVLLAVIGSNLCRVAENGTATIVQAVAAEKVGYFFLQDKLYFADGSNYYVYDGTTCAAAAPAADADLTNVKRCRFLVRHPKSSRIFAAGNAADQAALYFSQYGDPTYFKGSSVLYPTTGDGPVTGLSVFGDAVVVWFAHSVWVWRGIDPETDAVWVKVPMGQGASAGDTIQLTPNTMTFLGQGGLYAVAASLITGSGEFIPGLEAVKNLAEERVSSIIQDIANPAIAAGVWDMPRGRYLLAYRDTDAPDARNNRILVLNWHLGGFTRYIGIQANDFCLRGNGDLLVASNNYLLKMEQGVQDAGDVPIVFDMETKFYHLGAPFYMKKFYNVYLVYRGAAGAATNIDLTVKCDFDSEAIDGASLSSGSFVWGGPWAGVWGISTLETKRAKLSGKKGFRIQIGVANSQDQGFSLYGVGLEHKVVRKKGERMA